MRGERKGGTSPQKRELPYVGGYGLQAARSCCKLAETRAKSGVGSAGDVANDDAAGDDDYKPGHESDVDEEFQAD